MQFSIITPTFNEIKHLRKFLSQFEELKNKFDYEMILGDSSSTDGTIEYARGKGIKVEVTPERGISLGRNTGAKNAKGDVLIFIDAAVTVPDVEFFFQRVIEVFEDEKIIAATTNVRVDPKIALVKDKVIHEIINYIVRFVNLLGLGAGKGECQMIRASAFRKVGGYDEKIVAAEDNELYRRLAKIGKIVFIKDLQVYDDPIRYRKLGYPRVISQWIMNQISVIFTGKAYSKVWKRID